MCISINMYVEAGEQLQVSLLIYLLLWVLLFHLAFWDSHFVSLGWLAPGPWGSLTSTFTVLWLRVCTTMFHLLCAFLGLELWSFYEQLLTELYPSPISYFLMENSRAILLWDRDEAEIAFVSSIMDPPVYCCCLFVFLLFPCFTLPSITLTSFLASHSSKLLLSQAPESDFRDPTLGCCTLCTKSCSSSFERLTFHPSVNLSFYSYPQ